ncbi:MAG: hypothetical protein AB1413_03265 [Thermodesulfobacteriota bacterium]
MKDAIAIAIAKARKKAGTLRPSPPRSAEIDEDISRTGVGILLFAGAAVGMGGFVCLIVGLVQSGSVAGLLRGWVSALGGG